MAQLTYNHWSFDQQTEHIVQPNCDAMDTTRPIMDKLCCIDCGTLFASTSHLQIHAKRGCPEVHARDVDQLLKRCKYGSTFESEEERREKSRRWVMGVSHYSVWEKRMSCVWQLINNFHTHKKPLKMHNCSVWVAYRQRMTSVWPAYSAYW